MIIKGNKIYFNCLPKSYLPTFYKFLNQLKYRVNSGRKLLATGWTLFLHREPKQFKQAAIYLVKEIKKTKSNQESAQCLWKRCWNIFYLFFLVKFLSSVFTRARHRNGQGLYRPDFSNRSKQTLHSSFAEDLSSWQAISVNRWSNGPSQMSVRSNFALANYVKNKKKCNTNLLIFMAD